MGISLRILSIGVIAGLLLAPAAYAQGSDYEKLVSQAQADLNAGNAAKALVESQQAIKSAPARWEAYVASGGALQLEHQYSKAVADFAQALDRAPQAKKSAVTELLQKAVAEQTGAQSNSQSVNASVASGANNGSSDPSYADTVQYIQAKIGQAGLPGSSQAQTGEDVVCTSRDSNGGCSDVRHVQNGVKASSADDGFHYTVAIDGCNNLVVVQTRHWQSSLQSIDPSTPGNGNTSTTETARFKIPFSAILSINAGQKTPPDLRDKSHLIGEPAPILPPLNPMPRIFIVMKDNSATFEGGSVSSDPSLNFSQPAKSLTPDIAGDNVALTPSGPRPFVNIWFGTLGGGDLVPHFQAALKHLVDICVKDPAQAPKQPF